MGQTMSQQLQSVVNGGPGLSGMAGMGGALGGSGMAYNPGMGNGMSGPPVSSSATQVSPAGGEFAFPDLYASSPITQGGGSFASDYPRGAGFGSALADESGMPRPPVERSMFDHPAFSGGTPRPTPRPFPSLGGALGDVPGFANGGALEAFGGAGPDVESLLSRDTNIGPSSIGDSGDSSSFTYADNNRSVFDSVSDNINDFLNNIDFGGQDGPFNSLPSYNSQSSVTAPTAAGGITDALADQIAQNAARQEATAQIAAADREAMQPQIDAIAGSYTPGRDREVMDLLDAQGMARDMDASAQGKSVMDAFQDQYNMAQGSRIMDNYADSYNRRAQMADDKYAQDARSELSVEPVIADDIVEGGYEELVGATPEQGRVNIGVPNGYDAAGLNPVSIYDRNPNYEESVGRDLDTSGLPTVSTESIMDRASRKDDMSDARNLVTRGFGAGMDPMEQLQARNERDIFDVDGPPGIGQAIQGVLNSVARGVTGNVLEKLEQPGSTPVYDETGQIVGVTHGGLFGGTVYTGRPDYNPTGRGANLGTEGRDEIRFNNRGGFSVGSGTGSSREAGGLDKFGAAVGDAGDAFLKMLKGG